MSDVLTFRVIFFIPNSAEWSEEDGVQIIDDTLFPRDPPWYCSGHFSLIGRSIKWGNPHSEWHVEWRVEEIDADSATALKDQIQLQLHQAIDQRSGLGGLSYHPLVNTEVVVFD